MRSRWLCGNAARLLENGEEFFPAVFDAIRTARCEVIVEGTCDELATLRLLQPLVQGLGDRATLALFDDADHAFHVRARSGRTDTQTLASMLDTFAGWARARQGLTWPMVPRAQAGISRR